MTVAGDGGFSVPVTLAAGASQFTLSATGQLSRRTTTPFTVTLSTGGPPPTPTANPRAVVFGKSGKLTLKLSLKLTGKRTGAATTTTKKTPALKKKR